MGGRQRPEEGLSEKGREQVGKRSKGGKIISMELSRGGHRPVYSIFTNHSQRGPWPCDFSITNEK